MLNRFELLCTNRAAPAMCDEWEGYKVEEVFEPPVDELAAATTLLQLVSTRSCPHSDHKLGRRGDNVRTIFIPGSPPWNN